MKDLKRFLYEGGESYVFISYAHMDSETVLPIIEALLWRGFRVWFDLGIQHGSNWDDVVADHIKNAAVVMTCLSDNFVNSDWCRNEFLFAIKKKKPTLMLYLEDEKTVKLPSGIEMNTGTNHHMNMLEYPTFARFMDNLYAAKILSPCQMDDPPDLNASNKPDTFDLRGYERKSFWKSALQFIQRTVPIDFAVATIVIGFWGKHLRKFIPLYIPGNTTAHAPNIFSSNILNSYVDYLDVYGGIYGTAILALISSSVVILLKYRGRKLYRKKWEERYHYCWYCDVIVHMFAILGMLFYPHVLAMSSIALPVFIIILLQNPINNGLK